jgi:hypothetical protein
MSMTLFESRMDLAALEQVRELERQDVQRLESLLEGAA